MSSGAWFSAIHAPWRPRRPCSTNPVRTTMKRRAPVGFCRRRPSRQSHVPRNGDAACGAALAAFCFEVDLTAQAAVLPGLGRDLGAASPRAAWAIDVYSLALDLLSAECGQPSAGRYGRVQMFTWGAGLFGLASLLCACATTFDVSADIPHVARYRRRLHRQHLVRPPCRLPTRGLAACAGVLDFGARSSSVSMVRWPAARIVAGQYDPGWRRVFWINLPLCAVLVVLVLLGWQWARSAAFERRGGFGSVPAFLRSRRRRSRSCCWKRPRSAASRRRRASPGLAASRIALLLFVWVEHRHPNPAVDLKLFGSRQFIAMCLVPIAGSTGFWSLLVYVPQLARGPLGLSPLGAGWLLVALRLPMMVLPRYGAYQASPASQSRTFFCGGLARVGMADLALGAISGANAGPSTLAMTVIALLVSRSSCAVINGTQITFAGVSAVPGDRAATASAIASRCAKSVSASGSRFWARRCNSARLATSPRLHRCRRIDPRPDRHRLIGSWTGNRLQ